METRTLQFENPHFLQSLFANDLALLKTLEVATSVKITTRDGWVRLDGEDSAISRAESVFRSLESARRKGVEITQQSFAYAVESSEGTGDGPKLEELSEIRLLGSSSKGAVTPKTAGQLAYVEALQSTDVVFGLGPAGTGKTFLAVASALQALKNRQVKRIILTRPAVEAGESLGFLPGDLKEKIFPYLRPLYDAIYDMIETAEIERWIEKNVIEIAPLAYMRGRTLNDAFVILDEAQNTTCEQMFMFLTRMGERSRCAVTGDPTQIDLKRGVRSGLHEAMSVLKDVDGVRFCPLTDRDVVRHSVVQRIIRAYKSHRDQQLLADSAENGQPEKA
ncbi:MAG: phosphate starvation-inducible PhoH-like protein [Verrucomicrobiales bacterium]|jgi:phosphate starvation-inducible PhoH-like protein